MSPIWQTHHPDFGHFLGGQSAIKSEEIKGTLKVKITQLLMLAAYHNEARDEVFDILPGLFAQIRQEPTNGLNFPAIFVRYLAETQSPEDVKKLIKRTKQLSAEVGGEMLTASQAWTSQVRREGRLEKEIEMVERFLKAGVAWDVVVKATGITQEKLQELKATLQEMMARHTQLESSRPLDIVKSHKNPKSLRDPSGFCIIFVTYLADTLSRPPLSPPILGGRD